MPIHRINQLQSISHLSSTGLAHKGHLHSNLMMIAWLLVSNLGLWALFFKYSRIYTHIHAFLMSVTVIMTVISGFMAFVEYGFNGMERMHVVLGITIMIVVLMTASSGQMAHGMRVQPGNSTKFVVLMNKAHRILGWIILLIVWIQLLSTFRQSKKKGTFALVLIINLLSYGLFLLFKFKFKKTSQETIFTQDKLNSSPQLKQIKNQSQLAYLNKDYFIFEDKIYDIDHVLSSHPGGWDAIKAIKGRQVDRYIYGTQPLQISTDSSMTFTNHYSQSIHLSHSPIAILYNPSPYPSLSSSNPCSIEQLTKQCQSSNIYTVYLLSKLLPFSYHGYSQLTQIGKYWAVQINKKIVRLYSCVNFLDIKNLKIMNQIRRGEIINGGWKKVIVHDGLVKQVEVRELPIDNNYIALCMKKYEDGEFTKQFLSGKFTNQVIISKPRGRGLRLHQLKSTQKPLLLFAAGTGHYPYCDLLDLLFKQSLIQTSHALSQQILEQSPILTKTNLFSSLSLSLYITIQNISQIHPITLYQCNYLAQKGRIKVYVLTKNEDENTRKIFNEYRYLERCRERFQNVARKWVEDGVEGFSVAYVCGKPSFNKVIVDEFKAANIGTHRYHIL